MYVFSVIIVLVGSGALISGQKFAATVTAENQTVYATFNQNDKTVTSHQLTCAPDWKNPPQPELSWDFTGAPMLIEGMDYVGSNGSVTDGILWLSFIRLSPNTTGTYACVAKGANGTSVVNFEVYVSDGSLSIGVIAGIVLVSIVLAVAAVAGVIFAARRYGYISM